MVDDRGGNFGHTKANGGRAVTALRRQDLGRTPMPPLSGCRLLRRFQ